MPIDDMTSPDEPTRRPAFSVDDFRQHHTELRRYLRRRVSGAHDLDDLAQEVYLRMLRVQTGELLQKPLAYIFGIAANVVSEFYLRQYRSRVVFDSDAADAVSEALSGSAVDDSGVLLNTQVEQALKALPPKKLAVLVLQQRDGLSLAEIAAKLDLSEHTVKKYGVDALAQVRAALVSS